MIYWKRFIGDIRSKTAGLTLAEFGAYDRLLDEYYATGGPINGDSVRLFRICGALSDEEQRAVIRVRDQFFRRGKDGLLHHDRADRQIESEARFAKQQSNAAHARWEKERMRKTGGSASDPAQETGSNNPSETNDLHAGASAEPHPETMVSQPQPQPQNREDSAVLRLTPVGARAKKPREPSTGTRIDPAWILTPELEQAARSIVNGAHATVDIALEAAKFRDHWQATPGARGRKSDWDATWRNWIRRAIPQGHRPGAPHAARPARKPSLAEQTERDLDLLEQRGRTDPH